VPPLPPLLAALVYPVSNLYKKYFLFVPIIKILFNLEPIELDGCKVNKNKAIYIFDKKKDANRNKFCNPKIINFLIRKEFKMVPKRVRWRR
jgi:hypothetical protein